MESPCARRGPPRLTLHITAGGRTRVVDISRSRDRFLVSLDGRQHEVDVKVINGVWSMLVGAPKGPAKTGPYDPNHVGADVGADVGAGVSRPARSYEVAFSRSAEGAMTVHIDGVPVEVSINRMRRTGASAASHPSDRGPQRVTAPMPGKIVKLLVKPGDKVQPRQGVVVVEAMKMENELRARAAGTVSEVRVTEGTSVEAGAILIILE
jgi:biotin carboxyl carrier protein